MTEKLPPGKIESLLPLLKDQAELIKKNNSPSTSELFNILLLGIDLEEQKWATNELKKWEEILKKAKDTEEETIKEATWRALMLRGVPEASARLAVETVSASLIIKPNEEIFVPKSSTNIKSDIKLPINIDCESISFGELKPGKSAEKKIKISGGPGNIRVNSDVITVNPDYFGPEETIITVKIKNGIRGQIIWSEIVLEDSEESKTIPVTARWSDDGLNKSSANPIDRQAAIEKDLKIINTNKLPPTVPKTPKIPAVNYPTTVIRKPQQPKINKGNKILLPITIVIILILISGLIFAKNFKFLKYINVAGEETLNKNYNVTEEYYGKNSEKNPDNIEKLLKMAEKSLSNKDFSSAISNYLKVIKLEPSNIKAHKGLAELYNLNKNYILLKDELDKLLSFGNKDLIIYYNESGKYFYQQKDYKKSIDCFEKFLQVNPDNLETHRSMGKIYMENNDYENAIKEYKRVLDLSGSDKEAYINTGTAYYRLKDYNSANEWFKKAIQTKLNRDEKKSIISMNIECYLKIGQMNTSQFKYKKAE
ncbi:MAG: tetratricopeptide repeat protein, partial [Candidatus Eremiobacterota bacterium]